MSAHADAGREGARVLTTQVAVDAVAWERAPRYPGRSVNQRIVCADGYSLSVQASTSHYADDSSGGPAPYWSVGDREPIYPFTTFEVGAVDSPPKPKKVWREHDVNGGESGIYPWVPKQTVADLLDRHGGAVAWQPTRATTPPTSERAEGRG